MVTDMAIAKELDATVDENGAAIGGLAPTIGRPKTTLADLQELQSSGKSLAVDVSHGIVAAAAPHTYLGVPPLYRAIDSGA
jgi:hypothetical protein